MDHSLRSAWAWAPLVVALLLAVAILGTGSNVSLFLLLNRAGHPLGDGAWANLTMLGDGAVALALVLPTIKRWPRRFWAALIAAVIAALWVQLMKQVINVPRPLAVLASTAFFQSGPALRAVSFPSGHAAAVFAIVGIWVMSLSRQYLLRAGLLALAVLVSVSRMMVGVHWPLDIVGGMVGGWLGAWTGLVLAGRWAWKSSGVAGLVAGVILLVVAAALLVSKHIGFAESLPLQRALGAACLLLGGYEMFLMLPRSSSRRHTKGE